MNNELYFNDVLTGDFLIKIEDSYDLDDFIEDYELDEDQQLELRDTEFPFVVVVRHSGNRNLYEGIVDLDEFIYSLNDLEDKVRRLFRN